MAMIKENHFSIFKVLLICLGVLIVLFLIIGLFTPERIKTRNYIWYLQNRPQIVAVKPFGSPNCIGCIETLYDVDNPALDKYITDEKLGTCEMEKNMGKRVTGNDSVSSLIRTLCINKIRREASVETGIPLTLSEKHNTCSELCNHTYEVKSFFQIFQKQLFVVKKEYLNGFELYQKYPNVR